MILHLNKIHLAIFLYGFITFLNVGIDVNDNYPVGYPCISVYPVNPYFVLGYGSLTLLGPEVMVRPHGTRKMPALSGLRCFLRATPKGLRATPISTLLLIF